MLHLPFRALLDFRYALASSGGPSSSKAVAEPHESL